MHVLFIHKNYPAQFRYIAPYLVRERGHRCTFVSEKLGEGKCGVDRIHYSPKRSSREHTCDLGRPFDQQMWASQALFECLAARDDIQPDLIVAHSGFFTASVLRVLYDCPTISFFEYFYHTTNSDCDFRSDLPQGSLEDRARTVPRNATFLLDLVNCDAGYAPTDWQSSRMPEAFRPKISVIHDGIDTQQWQPATSEQYRLLGEWIPRDTKVVTYVTRGFESMRGFDVFMKVAKRLCDERNDVIFLVAGDDRVVYGGDRRFTGDQSFKQWVLAQDNYDLERIRFVGSIPRSTVASMLQRSDLHIYLTVPFVISWSPLDALASGCVVLGSDTPPVREVIQHGRNGLLCDFFDVDGFVHQAHQVLDDPETYAGMRLAARQSIRDQYSLEVSLPRLASLYEAVANHRPSTN